jgi:hypothetical protein
MTDDTALRTACQAFVDMIHAHYRIQYCDAEMQQCYRLACLALGIEPKSKTNAREPRRRFALTGEG